MAGQKTAAAGGHHVFGAKESASLDEEQSIHLGIASDVQVLTYGEPGNRTFNITAYSTRGSAVVWMEKEELFSIASSLQKALEDLDVNAPIEGEEPALPSDADGDAEFKIAGMAMQYDAGRKVFIFGAAGIDRDARASASDDESPQIVRIQFGFSHRQAEYIARRGLEIVYAGRPICTYCHVAIDQGEEHTCRRRNGHDPEFTEMVIEGFGGDDDDDDDE